MPFIRFPDGTAEYIEGNLPSGTFDAVMFVKDAECIDYTNSYRIACIEIIGKSKGFSFALPALHKLAGHKDALVAKAALRSMGNISPNFCGVRKH
jgi:hypothetical protein